MQFPRTNINVYITDGTSVDASDRIYRHHIKTSKQHNVVRLIKKKDRKFNKLENRIKLNSRSFSLAAGHKSIFTSRGMQTSIIAHRAHARGWSPNFPAHTFPLLLVIEFPPSPHLLPFDARECGTRKQRQWNCLREILLFLRNRTEDTHILSHVRAG